MDPRAEALVRRFLEIETAEVVISTVLGGGHTGTVRRPHAVALESDPARGVVVLDHDGGVARLQLDERELLHVLGEVASETGGGAWGPGIPAAESSARYLSVWLDECLATREAHPSGWWTLRDCWFEPVPPWEAPRRH